MHGASTDPPCVSVGPHHTTIHAGTQADTTLETVLGVVLTVNVRERKCNGSCCMNPRRNIFRVWGLSPSEGHGTGRGTGLD